MSEVTQSRDGISILKVKTEITVQLKAHHGHLVKGKYGSFAPVSLHVEAWRGADGLPAKAKVTCKDVPGFHAGKTFPDTKIYNLVGYPDKAPLPKWIAFVIREFGYQDPIEKIEGM